MYYSQINKNDIVNGIGISVSLFVSGCPHHCPGCFNPETWDYNYGEEFTSDTTQEIIDSIEANGVLRNFSILGGEPLSPPNRETVSRLVSQIRDTFGHSIKIYIWTGYIYEKLRAENDSFINSIFSQIDFLIDGPFIEAEKSLSSPLKGSKNQRIIRLV